MGTKRARIAIFDSPPDLRFQMSRLLAARLTRCGNAQPASFADFAAAALTLDGCWLIPS